MGALMDKLNATNASKEQIRQAIERKKVSVPENTPLKDYPAKIDGIYPDALFFSNAIYPKELPKNLAEFVVSAHGNGIDMIKFGANRTFTKKDDDTVWHECVNASNKTTLSFGNGWFVTMDTPSSGQQRVFRSKNGKSWEESVIADIKLSNASGLVFDGMEFAFLTENGAKVCSSADGKNWEVKKTTGLSTRSSLNLFFDDKTKKYYTYSYDSGVRVSVDKVNWKFPTANFPHETYSDILCVADGRMIYRIMKYTDKTTYSLYDLEKQTALLNFSTDTIDNVDQVIYKNGVFSALHFVIYKEMKLSIPHDNFTNVFTTNNTFARYEKTTGKVVYSYDGVNYFDGLNFKIINTKDEDVTIDVVRKLADIQTTALQAAYEEGVNSI